MEAESSRTLRQHPAKQASVTSNSLYYFLPHFLHPPQSAFQFRRRERATQYSLDDRRREGTITAQEGLHIVSQTPSTTQENKCIKGS